MGLCFGSLFLLGTGILSIFAKDILWGLVEWNNSLKGLESKRTPDWDMMTTIGGVIALVLGLIGMYATFRGG